VADVRRIPDHRTAIHWLRPV